MNYWGTWISASAPGFEMMDPGHFRQLDAIPKVSVHPVAGVETMGQTSIPVVNQASMLSILTSFLSFL